MKYLTVEQLLEYTTISVEEAAYVSNISRSTGYDVVDKGGFFETVVINERTRVLTRPLYKKLMGTAAHDQGTHQSVGSPERDCTMATAKPSGGAPDGS